MLRNKLNSEMHSDLQMTSPSDDSDMSSSSRSISSQGRSRKHLSEFSMLKCHHERTFEFTAHGIIVEVIKIQLLFSVGVMLANN